MRYVIVGAGAIGGTVGARLAQHGHRVHLVARGQHAAVIAEAGLEFVTPEGSERLRLPVSTLAELAPQRDDVLMLAVKSQHTQGILAQLADRGVGETSVTRALPVVCLQNGVDNERTALRLFQRAYGVCVYLPATHLDAGTVVAGSTPLSGLLDIGVAPRGIDPVCERIAGDLSASRFSSVARADIMRWKYQKLLGNLANALDATCGRGEEVADLADTAMAEGRACLAAAGIDVATEEEVTVRRNERIRVTPIPGHDRSGSSSWQSLARGTGSIEADYLNGEICLLGRLHAIPTPVNEALRHWANIAAVRRLAPGTVTAEQIRDTAGLRS